VRIASLVPSATELLFALGLDGSVVAVTHECDHPPAACRLPHLTRSAIPEGLPAGEIDRAVKERIGRGEALYELDEQRLAALDPELVVTQAVCEVCAVSFDDVRAAAERLPSRPTVLSLDPATLEDVLADVDRLGQAAGAAEAAGRLLTDARERLGAVSRAVRGGERPRVAALEWLDPLFVAGHWVPEMIALAGGEDALGHQGERSREAGWAEARDARPDVVVCMPCGYGTERSASEAQDHRDPLATLGAERIVAVDASSYFSRPGPRLVDGVELLGHLLHPDRVPAPPPGRHIVPEPAAARG
jgi:iron complex transport system substrate-binding protein